MTATAQSQYMPIHCDLNSREANTPNRYHEKSGKSTEVLPKLKSAQIYQEHPILGRCNMYLLLGLGTWVLGALVLGQDTAQYRFWAVIGI